MRIKSRCVSSVVILYLVVYGHSMKSMCAVRSIRTPVQGIWINAKEIANLPISGPAWAHVKEAADTPTDLPNLSDQDNNVDVQTMAKALAYARLHNDEYRQEVLTNIILAMGTERGARTIALGKNMLGYIIAADLVGLPPEIDKKFKSWLASMLTTIFKGGKTLISTNEKKPNNWGTLAGAVRAAISIYVNDPGELQRTARVFKGYLGDRKAYAGFRYKHVTWWQAVPSKPVGINPKGARKFGHNIDGVLPDDQRRAGPFTWPPPKENYVYTGLQGAVAQAVVLYRRGYDVFNWQDKALLRAFKWLYNVAHYPASGDDVWMIHVINSYYGADFPAPLCPRPGKNVGWTDWTYGPKQSSKGN